MCPMKSASSGFGSGTRPASHPFQTGEADYDRFTSYFTPPSPDEGFNVIVHRE